MKKKERCCKADLEQDFISDDKLDDSESESERNWKKVKVKGRRCKANLEHDFLSNKKLKDNVF